MSGDSYDVSNWTRAKGESPCDFRYSVMIFRNALLSDHNLLTSLFCRFNIAFNCKMQSCAVLMVMSMTSLSDPGRGLGGAEEESEGKEMIEDEKDPSYI